ncbi:hypothetical protein DUNSADRAFT_2122 [Dunaliella salina]|uniref:FAS1 domain-containing protein n=1 Tax=Dunaliella salina TaxID=3046 RepID=A0ABQ7FWL0_DUNSA|nr:hypothetical protein DUNSADRAFT_2122 [Dunaliella salina]|eukprot:KAF5826757.1 hypothetical protein DUNSADRAFT_2122 [Dunaliella salina]
MAPSLGLGLLALVALSGFANAASHADGPSDYSNFYEAIEMYSQNHNDELSALKGLLDAEPYSAIKDELMAAANGTFFAPTNTAAGNFLSAVGYGSDGTKPVSPADVLGIESLKNAVGESLMLHYVNGSYTSPSTGDSGIMHHEWWLLESENRTAMTFLGEELYLFADGNSTTDMDLKIYYSSEHTMDNLAATVVGKDIARTNATAVDAEHEGHVHTIDTVLMSPSLKNLANSGVGFNFEDEIDAAGTLTTVKAAIMVSDVAKFSVLGPGLKGAVFAPTDAAFDAFIDSMNLNVTKFLGNANQVKRVLYEHIIPTEVTTSSPNENTTTQYDTLMDGNEGGAPVSVKFVESEVTMLMNDGESAEATLVGCNFQGGCVYTIGKVLISNDTKNFLMSDFSSPANGNWKDPNLLPADVSTADADAAEELLQQAGLAGLLNDAANTESFTMFLPKEAARQDILGPLNIGSSLSDASIGQDRLQKLLNSYRVPASAYDGSLVEGTAYQTENPDVMLTKTADGITIEDVTSGRKLLAKAEASGLSSSMQFDNGKTIYFMNNMPVTDQMIQDALSGAGQATPSIFTIASMLIGAVVALLSL